MNKQWNCFSSPFGQINWVEIFLLSISFGLFHLPLTRFFSYIFILVFSLNEPLLHNKFSRPSNKIFHNLSFHLYVMRSLYCWTFVPPHSRRELNRNLFESSISVWESCSSPLVRQTARNNNSTWNKMGWPRRYKERRNVCYLTKRDSINVSNRGFETIFQLFLCAPPFAPSERTKCMILSLLCVFPHFFCCCCLYVSDGECEFTRVPCVLHSYFMGHEKPEKWWNSSAHSALYKKDKEVAKHTQGI